jgi:tetratricopeptide (TPR) repeat protein
MRALLALTLAFSYPSICLASWPWRPADAAKEKIENITSEHQISLEGAKVSGNIFDLIGDDFKNQNKIIDDGDQSSQALTSKVWKVLRSGDYDLAIAYGKRCIELYSAEADKMHSSLDYKKNHLYFYRALSDVTACYFIIGEIFRLKGDYPRALKIYSLLIQKYPDAIYWEP